MKTILVFDCWLPGYKYIRELATDFDVRVVFVHTSSLQLGAPAAEFQSFKKDPNIPAWVEDFGRYDYSFERLFAETRPDALLVLSMHHIEARTALYFGHHAQIPTFFVPHGIFVLDGDATVQRPDRSFGESVSLLVSKVPRVTYYLRYFLKFHFQMVRSGLRRVAPLETTRLALEMVLKFARWQHHPSERVQDYYGPVVDSMLIYDQGLEQFYRGRYQEMVAQARFIETGTLDGGRLRRQIENGLVAVAPEQTSHAAYFISTPYNEYFDEPDKSTFIDIVRKLRIAMEEAGIRPFVYRPHPGEPVEFTEDVRVATGAEIDWNSDLSGLIAAPVIVSTSSSLMYCACLLGKTIVNWASQRLVFDLPYYEPLKSYPRIEFDADLDRDAEAINALKTATGHTPSADPSRIADPLADLMDAIA